MFSGRSFYTWTYMFYLFFFLSFKVKVCQYPEEISKAFKLPLFPVFLMELITS